jgi:hypothetical protein
VASLCPIGADCRFDAAALCGAGNVVVGNALGTAVAAGQRIGSRLDRVVVAGDHRPRYSPDGDFGERDSRCRSGLGQTPETGLTPETV